MTTLLNRSAPRFTVETWDVGYGSTVAEDGLSETRARVTLDVELPEQRWSPIDPTPGMTLPNAVLFVDGVRRIDARVWFDSENDPAGSAGICASYAAGVVCCCEGRAHLVAAEVRRGVFTATETISEIVTRAGRYQAHRATVSEKTPLPVALSLAVQNQLAETEIAAATAARSGSDDHPPIEDDLLVVDGPLRGRTHLDRIVGYIKSHQSEYLPAELNAMVAKLAPGQRTPVFRIGTNWDRYSWYLRLPGEPGAPWAGIVRLEASATLSGQAATDLAGLTQLVLGRYASNSYKDHRAPQNLYPIAGLERHLRHRLGDQQFVYRALRSAAT